MLEGEVGHFGGLGGEGEEGGGLVLFVDWLYILSCWSRSWELNHNGKLARRLRRSHLW